MAMGGFTGFLRWIMLKGKTGNVITSITSGAREGLDVDLVNKKVLDYLDSGGVNASISVGTSAVRLRVGASELAGRMYLIMEPQDNKMYFGFSSGVTTANGIQIFKDQIVMIPVGPNTQVWAIADGAGKSIRIAEVA